MGITRRNGRDIGDDHPVVKDDPGAARMLQQALEEAGYGVEVVANGLAELSRGQRGAFDLILLDLMLPGLDGFEVCRRLRDSGVTAPILVLTALDGLDDVVRGLDSGADDYLVKPFRVVELLARARAMLRRVVSSTANSDLLRIADLTLDPTAHIATRGGRNIALSSTETALLACLMRGRGRVVARPRILEEVWQYDFAGNDNVLDVYIGYLRRKIDRDFDTPLIQTVRGVGFRVGLPYAP